MQDGILSIQSHVAYGHVGNASAVFPLQRLGFEVWPVNTVLFSNHTGHGAWRGRAVPLDWVRALLTGIEERGAFAACRAVLSGYLGTPDLAAAVLEAVDRVRKASPDALYACDPVMGDRGEGFYVEPAIPALFKDAIVPRADIVTPNAFELGHLSGLPVTTLAEAIAAAAAVRRLGPSIVCCTSLLVADRPGELAVLADTAQGSWLCRTPLLDIALNGTGDAFTALFLGAYLGQRDAASALGHATAAMFALVERTRAAGERELLLIAAQDELVHPSRLFPVERVR